jgi:hypothetical protein
MPNSLCLSSRSHSNRFSGKRSSRELWSTYLIRTLGASGATDRTSGDRSTLAPRRLGPSSFCGCGRSAVAGMCKRPAIPHVMRFTCGVELCAGTSGVGAGVASLGFAARLV